MLFALLASLCNALNITTQHVASTSDPKKSSGWRFVLYLFTSPLWLLGWIALAGSFLFQALALHRGEMSVVQPLLVTELVLVLVLRRVWIHQAIRPITWWAAGATCVTLALFVAMSEPQGGNAYPSGRVWVATTAATLAVAAVLALLGMRGSPGRRAALLGSSTAILNQAALHVGPLSTSQPFLVVVDPVVSIALSVWIFEEYFTPSPVRITLAVLGFAGMCSAATVLIRTAPATMAPSATA